MSGGSDQVLQLDDDYAAIKGTIGEASMPWLVALATCHWFHCVEGLAKNTARRTAVKEKRHRAIMHFEEAWDMLEKAGWFRGLLPLSALHGEGGI